MNIKQIVVLTLALMLFLLSCSNSISILEEYNFNSGDWLLVNKDNIKGTLKVIDDEAVLANNPTGIKVSRFENCNYTTCDGTLKLYKDGELIAQQDYLSQSHISENSEIKAAYKNGTDGYVYSYNKVEFKEQWDSLKQVENCYPISYYVQPDDKDIIFFYKYE